MKTGKWNMTNIVIPNFIGSDKSKEVVVYGFHRYK